MLYSHTTMRALIHRISTSTTTADKGKALEDFTCYLFGGVPGITITQRNTKNAFNTEEIDIALWNTKHRDGFYFLDFVVLIECKNWSTPVGSSEVSWFSEKLRSRSLDFGILIAMHGITGDPRVINEADSIVARALAEHRRIIVLERDDLFGLRASQELVARIQQKLALLILRGSAF